MVLPDKINLRNYISDSISGKRTTWDGAIAPDAESAYQKARQEELAKAEKARALRNPNKGFTETIDKIQDLTITHIASNGTVGFPAFITSWNDTFTQEWNSTTLIGRMDSIQTYKRTGRKISFGWDVVSTDYESAKLNFIDAKALMRFSYPAFEEIDYKSYSSVPSVPAAATPAGTASRSNADAAVNGEQNTQNRKVGIMSTPPIFKIKFKKWADDLYGTIDSLSFNPKFDSSETGFYQEEADLLVPKTLSFNCNFTVIHTNPLGFKGDKFRGVLYGDR